MKPAWAAGYAAALLAAVPFALPCWNGFLRDAIGRFITIEAIHVGEYAGLGWLASAARHGPRQSWRRLAAVVALIAGVGLVDELLQLWVPQRVFQWSDVAWNWLGGGLGLLLGRRQGVP